MSRLRGIIASRMVESLQTAAQLTATVEVDVTAISHLRKAVKDEFKRREGTGLTYLAFIAAATVEALKAFPVVNASIDDKNIVYHGAEHLGIAVDTERGLIVPVIKNAGDLNVGGLANRSPTWPLADATNKLGPDELSGATFTITNYGSAGTLFDTPVINQPNSGILGTGAMVKRPVVVTDQFLGNDNIAIRDMMYLSLTYDHRLIDGAVAAASCRRSRPGWRKVTSASSAADHSSHLGDRGAAGESCSVGALIRLRPASSMVRWMGHEDAPHSIERATEHHGERTGPGTGGQAEGRGQGLARRKRNSDNPRDWSTWKQIRRSYRMTFDSTSNCPCG